MATKKCPFCAEEIQIGSLKCHFCGGNIEIGRWKNCWLALYSKRKALEERKKIESLDPKEAQHNKNSNWLTLYFKRKRLEELQKINALINKKNGQD